MTLDYQRFVLIPKSEGNATISDLMMCRGNCVLLPASDRFGQEHGPRHLYESTCARRLRMSFFWHGQYQVVLSCFLAYLIGVSCELTFHKGQSVVEIIHSKIVYHFAITICSTYSRTQLCLLTHALELVQSSRTAFDLRFRSPPAAKSEDSSWHTSNDQI